MIDCHVHSLSGAEGNPGVVQDRMSAAQLAVRGMELMRATLEGGITAVRDCGGKDYIEFAMRDAFNAGRFLGPPCVCRSHDLHDRRPRQPHGRVPTASTKW
jgi:imidazolonepropionase-like amidohydrolase